MKKNVKNLLVLIGLLLFCLAFSLIFSAAGRNAVKDTPVRKKEFENASANAVSILDVKGVMKLTAIN